MMRRLTTLTLVATLSMLGMSYSASASGNEPAVNASTARVLTLNGRSLREVVDGSGGDAVLATLVAQVGQDTGEIRGVVVNHTGQPVPDQRVELRRPSREGPGRAVAVTDVDGQFMFSGLGPGRYEVELREGGRVIATSGPVELSERAMHAGGVTVALPAPPPVPPPNRRRVSADQLLRGQPVTDTFNALQGILEPGYEVVVWDEAGSKTRGRVSSISDDQVVIFFRERRRFFRPARPVERFVTADSVTRIDIVDSTANGVVIGAAVGAAVAVGLVQVQAADLSYAALTLFGALGFSMNMGWLIDHLNTDPIYERPSQTPRVTLGPLLGRGRRGIAARVSF